MRTLLAGAWVLGAVMAADVLALAQEGGAVVVRSMGVSSGPVSSTGSLSRETVLQIGEALTLDEIQLEVALEMFKEFASERQTLGDRRQQEIEAARQEVEDGDVSAMITQIKESTAAYQKAVEALEARFLDDVRAMLAGEQAEAWPAAERVHRRAKHLPRLMRSEARVDLDELVREELAEERQEAASDLVERWAVQVDGLLVDRARKADDIGGAGFEGGVFLMDGGDDPYEPLREIDGRIAAATRQAVRTLAGLLEDDAIEAAFLQRAYPRVYRQTDGERRLEAARSLVTLSDEQREQLDAAADQWQRDVGPARERWVAAERAREEDDRLPPGVVVFVEGQDPSDSDKARDAVRELDERLEARMGSILTEQQLTELPERVDRQAEGSLRAIGPGGESIRIRR
ncbi:MAG: hypothetical protein ACIAS6_08395 [Phycisphaerales bacterium JB060]